MTRATEFVGPYPVARLNARAGHAVVLAHPNGNAKAFANLAQAATARDAIMDDSPLVPTPAVIGRRPFYVAFPRSVCVEAR